MDAGGGVSEPQQFLVTPVQEMFPTLSPDGRLLAYASDESGRLEVYVSPFPQGGAGRWQLSVNGGTQPLWSNDGNELYYLEAGALMAVPVSREPAFRPGKPQRLFEFETISGAYNDTCRSYDVSADGRRFVMIAPVEGDEAAALPRVRLVQDWYEEFRDREAE